MADGKRVQGSMQGRMSFTLALLLLVLGCAGPSEPDPRAVTMDVASELVDCHGFVAQQCLRVSMGPGGPWMLFYDQIEGFEFEPGYDYTLRVERRGVRPVPDGSAFTWRLLQVMRKVPAVGSEA